MSFCPVLKFFKGFQALKFTEMKTLCRKLTVVLYAKCRLLYSDSKRKHYCLQCAFIGLGDTSEVQSPLYVAVYNNL